ncbi:MAG: IMPACT family protein [Chitinophagaceae bacterium]
MQQFNNDYYNTIERYSTATFTDRGSKFIAHAYPINEAEDYKPIIKKLKEENPKANHFCYAYRVGLDNNNTRSSDAGEPNGSAGKPILNQIISKQVTNILVVVVRYFGGTLLGVPGLINAYKTATALALQTTPIIQKQVFENYVVSCDYTMINNVISFAKQYGCIITKQEILLFAQIFISVPKPKVQEVLFKISDLQGVKIEKN